MTKFLFALRESLKSFYKRAFVTWLSIATITGAIFVLGLFIFVSYNLQQQLKGIQSQVHAELFFKADTDENDAKALERKFDKLDWVDRTKFISKDDALEIFNKEFDPTLLEGLPQNPLPASVIIYFTGEKDLGEVAGKLEGFVENHNIIDATFLPTETMRSLANAREIFSWLTIAWAIIILFASIIVVTNTIRLAMLSRRETIDVMKLVGADRSFIRLPFIFEGIFQGIFSSLFSIGLLFLIGHIIKYALPSVFLLPNPLIIILGLFGIVFGVLGSRIAISKYV
ncbi:MAG: cell division protein FtsX [Candidatus Zixiibacteriota bacterium]